MASNRINDNNNGQIEEDNRCHQSSNSNITSNNYFMHQRQLSDGRLPTNYFLVFENGENPNSSKICFLEYFGTRGRNHHRNKLYLPQVIDNNGMKSNEINQEISKCIKEVLSSTSLNDLPYYDVTVRTGITYFFSKRFRFNQSYSIEEIRQLIEKRIPTTDRYYYYEQRYNTSQTDDSLHSSFCNIKPINEVSHFAKRLTEFKFFVSQHKHTFRVYLQSDDNQTHICTIDPAQNFAIVEFSKDFQRTSNIDFIRDRSSSQFKTSKTYDDIFDFRIQFQYNPYTVRDQKVNNIHDELCQQFSSLNSSFKNENILKIVNHDPADDYELQVCEELSRYVKYIRRDFGDVYKHTGDDELHENFSIYLESSAEYQINRELGTWKRQLDTRGIIYARLNLNTMLSSNSIDEDFLVSKLWNMGEGLTWLAGKYTTDKTQQSTIYHASNGIHYTAQEEALVQRIVKHTNLCFMLSLPYNATTHDIKKAYNNIKEQMDTKWDCIQAGRHASEKLNNAYQNYFNKSN